MKALVVQQSVFLYRASHNVLRDYKHL